MRYVVRRPVAVRLLDGRGVGIRRRPLRKQREGEGGRGGRLWQREINVQQPALTHEVRPHGIHRNALRVEGRERKVEAREAAEGRVRGALLRSVSGVRHAVALRRRESARKMKMTEGVGAACAGRDSRRCCEGGSSWSRTRSHAPL